jgi:catechol 2,3-dioxygenase
VASLDPALRFYSDVVGLQLHGRSGSEAVLGDGLEDVLVLVEEPDARRPGRHAGLYHVALLYPSRLELARAALRLSATRTPISGASDHKTHEAIYLDDPSGNGVELAADRPRETWPSFAEMQADPRPHPLDGESLFAVVAGETPRPGPEGLRIGHVHLHVSEIAPVVRFYREGLGFDLTLSGPSMAFFSAGGYHHHVGTNTWRGERIPPSQPGVIGLRRFTIELPDAGDVGAAANRLRAIGVPLEEQNGSFLTRDPSENELLVRAANGNRPGGGR